MLTLSRPENRRLPQCRAPPPSCPEPPPPRSLPSSPTAPWQCSCPALALPSQGLTHRRRETAQNSAGSTPVPGTSPPACLPCSVRSQSAASFVWASVTSSDQGPRSARSWTLQLCANLSGPAVLPTKPSHGPGAAVFCPTAQEPRSQEESALPLHLAPQLFSSFLSAKCTLTFLLPDHPTPTSIGPRPLPLILKGF